MKKTIQVVQEYKYPLQDVFDALLSRKYHRKWFFIEPFELCKFELKPGGAFIRIDRINGDYIDNIGRFSRFKSPHRISFCIQMVKYSRNVDQVAIAITPTRSGTRVTLTHKYEPRDNRNRNDYRRGWEDTLCSVERIINCHE